MLKELSEARSLSSMELPRLLLVVPQVRAAPSSLVSRGPSVTVSMTGSHSLMRLVWAEKLSEEPTAQERPLAVLG
jgi:hypothetical protein